jgi:hypothetical protein
VGDERWIGKLIVKTLNHADQNFYQAPNQTVWRRQFVQKIGWELWKGRCVNLHRVVVITDNHSGGIITAYPVYKY